MDRHRPEMVDWAVVVVLLVVSAVVIHQRQQESKREACESMQQIVIDAGSTASRGLLTVCHSRGESNPANGTPYSHANCAAVSTSSARSPRSYDAKATGLNRAVGQHLVKP